MPWIRGRRYWLIEVLWSWPFKFRFRWKKSKKTKTIGILKEIATFSWKHFSIAGAAFANFPSPISIISLTHSFQSNLSICQKYGWAHWHLLYFVTVSRINLNYFRFISIFLVGGWLLVRVFMFFFSSWQKLLYKQKFISKKRLSVGTKKMRIAGLFRVFTMHLQQINRFSFHVILSDWLCIAMSMLRYGSPSPPPHTHLFLSCTFHKCNSISEFSHKIDSAVLFHYVFNFSVGRVAKIIRLLVRAFVCDSRDEIILPLSFICMVFISYRLVFCSPPLAPRMIALCWKRMLLNCYQYSMLITIWHTNYRASISE